MHLLPKFSGRKMPWWPHEVSRADSQYLCLLAPSVSFGSVPTTVDSTEGDFLVPGKGSLLFLSGDPCLPQHG